MTAETAATDAAWENPLIPNAKLRQIYRTMVRLRALALAMPRQREVLGLEACLASTSIDLESGDFASDALSGGVVDFLRGATLGEVFPNARKRGPVADCGAAARIPAGPGVVERMWSAIGVAAALKAGAAKDRAENKASPKQPGLVVFYARPGEVPPVFWRSGLAFAARQELPMLFVVLPLAGGYAVGKMSALALRSGVPGIPVDTNDAIALYRVAQESIGRSRIGGGPALMECVPFAIAGAAGKRRENPDSIVGLEKYLLQRKVATPAWMREETKSFAKRVALEKAASK